MNSLENKQRSGDILKIVKRERYDKKVRELSIAIINLVENTSVIFGINMDAFMYPASVFKIFIGAEILRQIEVGTYTFNQKITIKPLYEVDRNSKFYPDSRMVLKTGDEVSIDRLLELMLAQSDNSASNCLLELIGIESVIKNVIEANGWKETGVTNYFQRQIKENKKYRYTETTQTCARHVAEFFALVEQEKLISQFVSKKLKEYMLKYDRTLKHRYSFSDFLNYRKGGYLETNLYTSFYRKSGFGFDIIKGFGSLIKNIFTKGWAFERYMHDAGVVEGEHSKYIIVIFTHSKQLNPRKFFHMDELAKDIFQYMENYNC